MLVISLSTADYLYLSIVLFHNDYVIYYILSFYFMTDCCSTLLHEVEFFIVLCIILLCILSYRIVAFFCLLLINY